MSNSSNAGKMDQILIVSNYYPPEKGAAANRIERLASQLHTNGFAVKVVCPLGNYPHGKLFQQYKGRFSAEEIQNGIGVKRLWIYPSNSSNIFKRMLSVLSFATGLFFYLLFAKLPQKVIVQSPPLMVSFVSVLALRIRGRKIILNISDLWPLAAIELRALKPGSTSHKLSLLMEKFIYKKASVVLGQSKEIIAHVLTIARHKPCFIYRNYPEGQTDLIDVKSNGGIKIFYAGLLGVAQGVLEVCEKIELGSGAEFHIFGDGAEKELIVKYIDAHPGKKIFFHGMLERRELMKELPDFDVALVPLRTRIYGSVPSKIFEYSGIGMPILYFGGGEGEQIVSENNLGWVADVGDFAQLNSVLSEIVTEGKSGLQARKLAIYETSKKQFNLDAQMQMLIQDGIF